MTRSPVVRLLALATLALDPAAAAAQDPVLVNPSFEQPGTEPPGWRTMVGARRDGTAQSSAAVDRTVGRAGSASLRLSGDGEVAVWRLVHQVVPVRPGDRVLLEVAARCRGIRREANQYRNANALLIFSAADGSRLGLHPSAILEGDRDWVDLAVHAIAPARAARADVGLFLSMSGTVWFDDVRLTIQPARPSTAAARAAAFDALRGHLLRTWPFFGLPGKPDPQALFARHRPRVRGAKDFLGAVKAMLAQLEDVHVWLDGPAGRQGTAPPQARPPNWNHAAIRRRLAAVTAHGGLFLAGRIDAGRRRIGYLQVRSFVMDAGRFEQVERALDGLATTDALILDVRMNGGGDENLARRIAGRFTDRRRRYARTQVRDPTRPGIAFREPTERWLEPLPGRKPDRRRVVVLQGPGCVSATEGFLLMARVLPTVTTVGLPSRGASGNPRPFPLLPHVQVWSSTWRSLTPEGACIEGVGLPPDVTVEADHRRDDPTLERAIALLGAG